MDKDAYTEDMTWTIRLEAVARFADDYDGDDDGFAWRDRFHREVGPAIAAGVLRALAGLDGWKVRPANRGMAQTDELLIRLERDY